LPRSTKGTVGHLGEEELIARYIAPIATDLGDDCAFVPPRERGLLLSTDSAVEGVHFLRTWPARLLAGKILRACASDVVASGGQPEQFLLALHLPGSLELTWLEQFFLGLADQVAADRMQLIGGNLSRCGRIVVNMTVLGQPMRHPIARSGAKPGDLLLVTGQPGHAALGLHRLLSGGFDDACPFIRRHFCPPNHALLVRDWLQSGLVRAMMDLSDGLMQDLPRLCAASSLGAVLHLDRLPACPLPDLEDTYFQGGEDYELLLACASEAFEPLASIAANHGTELHLLGTLCDAPGCCYLLKDKPFAPGPAKHRHFA
jgi:thiamine-monophosphate kinase